MPSSSSISASASPEASFGYIDDLFVLATESALAVAFAPAVFAAFEFVSVQAVKLEKTMQNAINKARFVVISLIRLVVIRNGLIIPNSLSVVRFD